MCGPRLEPNSKASDQTQEPSIVLNQNQSKTCLVGGSSGADKSAASEVVQGSESSGTLMPSGKTPWEITQRLLNEAITAVSALSNHLSEVPDRGRMYKANQALWKLWEIE